MITIRKFAGLEVTCWLGLLILVGFPPAGRAQAPPQSARKAEKRRQAAAAETLARSFPALLVSDVHFDPFHDPAKVGQLAEAPASQWGSILSGAASPDQEEAFASLQQSCQARGVDTPYALLHSSLEAMRARQGDAKFMMLSGDLLAHNFSCRYAALLPGARAGAYQAFVLKTLSFVVGELRGSFPGMAVYVSLGNNDSACGDYRLDAGSDFLAQTAKIVGEGLPAALPEAQRQEALQEFAAGGYYSVRMGAPMGKTRLIVVNDLFLSPRYRACDGGADPTAAATEMEWLGKELAEARRLGEKVWVMGHIPPGIDPYATLARFTDVCGGKAPAMFLSSERPGSGEPGLAELLIEYSDVVRLAIFGHSHMDEMRLLKKPDGRETASGHGAVVKGVAVKIVASISPVNGNKPSFTVAQVNPSTARLRDYEVIAASNRSGVGSVWSEEYDFAQAYHEAQFSAAAVKKLIAQFEEDRGARTEASREYLRNYFVGDESSRLVAFWPQYVCALENYTAKAYASCVCRAGK